MTRAFEAFALPRGIEPPGVGRASLPARAGDEAVDVRFAEWDARWLGRLVEPLAACRVTLGARSAAGILDSLARTGSRFLDPGDPVRKEALELLPPTSGLSPAMAEAVLDGMAAGWRREELEALLRAEFGSVGRLDGFGARLAGEPRAPGSASRTSSGGPAVVASSAGRASAAERHALGRATMPVGPRLCVQIVSGSVPGVGATALVRSLLVKGPTLLKAGRGDVVLPVLFARALAEIDAELADAVAVLYWPGGSGDLVETAVARADVVVAYGSDETVRAIRERTPVTTRFVAYHHRTSVGVVGGRALEEARIESTAEDVARAVALFDQRGCVSPQIVWVEGEDAGVARRFAGRLAGALDALEESMPGGTLDLEEASAVQQLRGAAEMVGAAGSELDVVHGGGRSWTVVLEAAPTSLPGCVGRVVRVRPLASLGDLPRLLEPLADHLQTVGIAGLGKRAEALAAELGRVGVSRLAPFAAVPFPPASWHHDGGRPLGDLVRWVDLELG